MVNIVNDPKQGGPKVDTGLSLGNASVSRAATFRGLNPENLPSALNPSGTLYRTQEEPGLETTRDLNSAAPYTRVIGPNGRTVGLTAGEIGVGPEGERPLSLDRSVRVGFPDVQIVTTAPSNLGPSPTGQNSRPTTIYDLRGRHS